MDSHIILTCWVFLCRYSLKRTHICMCTDEDVCEISKKSVGTTELHYARAHTHARAHTRTHRVSIYAYLLPHSLSTQL